MFAFFQANAVVDKIGFPAYILNKTALDKRYERVRPQTLDPLVIIPVSRPFLRVDRIVKEKIFIYILSSNSRIGRKK